jgi:hypothetical protein
MKLNIEHIPVDRLVADTTLIDDASSGTPVDLEFG